MSKVIFLPHGGGPMPALGDPGHAGLVKSLQGLQGDITNAKALLVITAHWEEQAVAISAQANPGMYYDYYNFPAEAYQLQYPAPGAPDLAVQVQELFQAAGIDAKLEHERGFDHGTFIPLMIIAPEAQTPVLQVSLKANLDPAEHIAMGRALAPLLDQGIVILGSGLSFHSFPAMRSTDKTEPLARSTIFDNWLNASVLGQDEAALVNWEQAPEGRYCHPREEHLLPLHVCFGAARAANLTAKNFYQETLFGTMNSGFIWQPID